MPHTYVILTIIILLVVVALCYLIPAGGTSVSWIRSAGKLWSFPIPSTLPREEAGAVRHLLSLQRGYVDAADILFLIVFAYGYVYILTKMGH